MPEWQLIIFVKAPRPGLVKTRLGKTLGAEGACAAYRQLVETLLRRLELLAEVELCYTPDDALAEVQPWLRPSRRAWPQGGGDLGRRLQSAMERTFAAGAKRVAVIGSDCPEVTGQDVQEAWRALETHEVVVGPALDGGYWLIGSRSSHPRLFEGIPWGSDQVLARTLEQARGTDLSVRLLRLLSDVDTEAEWRRFTRGTENV